MLKDKPILGEEFYGPLLASSSIPGEDDIPEELLRAMSFLIRRNVDASVNPEACAGAAALVVLAWSRMGSHLP